VFNHLKLKVSPTQMADSIGVNRVVLTLSIARLADALGNSILFIVIPLYVAQLPSPWFPLPDSVRVGLLISLYGLVNSIFQPIMGALSDRLSRRKPFIQSGLALMGIGTLAFAFAGRFSDLLLLRALQGIGVALTIPASMALIATATTKQTRGGSMGVYSSMRMVGFAAGPLIGGLLQLHFGFNTAFYVGAALLLVAMILVQVWVNDVPVRAATEAPGPFRIIDRELLAGGIMGLGIATFLMASAFSMMGALENEFNARLQQTVLGFSIAFSALTFSRLLVQVPLGRLSDRVGRKPLILVGLILMAPATALLGEAGTIVQLTGLRVFQGIASGAIAAPAFALAADLARSGGEGRQMSILTMGFGLGIALGPLIAGVLAVVFFELPFLLGGLMSLIGVWVVYRYVPETVQRSGAPALAWAKVKVSGERDQKGQRD
jgi:MFS family permease